MSDYDPLWEEGKSDLIDRIHELEDAAEFEAKTVKAFTNIFMKRLAMLLVNGGEEEFDIDDMLKEARLAVEEEMDNE
mgnify:CR=1 FL=1